MTEAPETTQARIVVIDAPPMSTIWTFTAEDAEGRAHVFHADWRPGRDMCEGLAAFARSEARSAGIEIPSGFAPGALVCAVNVELIPDETMGMLMPNVNPLDLNVECLKGMIDRFLRRA